MNKREISSDGCSSPYLPSQKVGVIVKRVPEGATGSDHNGQILAIDNTLPLGVQDPLGILINLFVGPVAPSRLNKVAQPIVLPEEDGVHHGQARILNDSGIA